MSEATFTIDDLAGYDRDGYLDFVVANYVDLDLKDAPKPGSSANCKWKFCCLSIWHFARLTSHLMRIVPFGGYDRIT